MRGYILPEEQTNRLGCALALVWLPLSFPFFLFAALSGGGCEAKPQPCEPRDWPMLALVAVVIVLGVSTSWTVKVVRSGAPGPTIWLARVLALLLAGLAAFIVWLLLTQL